MLTKRIIACLDVANGRVVKGVQFEDLIDAGAPAELAARHALGGADEIVLLDITATHEGRGTLIATVKETAKRLFVPFTVGGGIRTSDDATAVFDAGADKVSINSAALASPALIGEIGRRFGAQAVVVAIDARRVSSLNPDARRSANPIGDAPGAATPGSGVRSSFDQLATDPASQTRHSGALPSEPAIDAEVYASGGRKATGRKLIDWAREAEDRGAGEILLTSMDADGTRAGFDCALTALVSAAVQIPVIASGGAGTADHFADVLLDGPGHGRADAALAASIFHFGIADARQLKQQIAARGVSVRLPC